MRYVDADLLASVVSSYDKTKTTVFGHCVSHTVDGKQAVGTPLNKFIDVQGDAAVSPAANAMVMTENGRVFTFGLETSGLAQVALHTINYTTGATAYVGKLQFALPDVAATNHTYRYIKVLDSGTTGWKICVGTAGTVLINGGSFLINNIDLADFLPVGFPTIQFATGTNQKAVYFTQDPSFIGAGQLQTATLGAVLDKTAQKLYVHNGTAAVHQYHVFDLSVDPSYATASVTGVAATDRISHAGHGFVNGDQVVFVSLTGGAGLVVGTPYFVVNQSAGVDYQLSLTSGGAAINFTTDITSANLGRAFGISGSNFSHKTGNLPAISGTLLGTDSEDFATPGHTANAGFNCAFLCTTTAMYLGKLSELTVGATTWPSLITVNVLGAPNQIVNPTITYAAWSNVLDRAIYSVGQVFVIKQFVNNLIDNIFGGANNKYFEGIVTEVVEFQPTSSITSMDLEQGWIGVTTGSTGQRGIFVHDLRADAAFDHSYFITKVMKTPNAVYKFMSTIDALYDFTGSLDIYYRVANTESDTIFDSASGGWNPIPFAEDLSSYAAGEYVQFKALYATTALDTSIPAQLCNFFLGYESLTDNSSNWELSVDDSDNGNPSRTTFRLKEAYASSVPALRYIAYDLINSLVVDHNTTANAARFEYSTNSGVSWSPLGTIPNTVGTLVRYTFSTAPGVDIRPSLREA